VARITDDPVEDNDPVWAPADGATE
jgi:hypothetical protein